MLAPAPEGLADKGYRCCLSRRDDRQDLESPVRFPWRHTELLGVTHTRGRE